MDIVYTFYFEIRDDSKFTIGNATLGNGIGVRNALLFPKVLIGYFVGKFNWIIVSLNNLQNKVSRVYYLTKK